MRARNIKPGYYNNEELAACDPLARILFSGLWCLADREGRLEDRPKRIKRDVLGYDDCDADELLDQLKEHGFIHRYRVGESRYIQIVAFHKHQRPHQNEQASEIPPMPEAITTTDVPTSPQGSKSAQPRSAGLRSESLLSDTGISESLNPDPLVIDPPSPIARESSRVRAPAKADSPHGMCLVFLAEMGTAETDVAPDWFEENRAHTRVMLEQGINADKLTRYLRYEKQRGKTGLRLRFVKKDILDWEAAGEPTGDKPRGSPNGAKPTNTELSRAAIELVGDMVRSRTG